MQEWNVFEQDKIKLLGRSDRVSGGFHMDWTGCCVEFILQGCHAEVMMTAVNDGKEQWVLFEIDGIPSARIRLKDGTHWYTVLDTRGYPQSHRHPLRGGKHNCRRKRERNRNRRAGASGSGHDPRSGAGAGGRHPLGSAGGV